ncbi:hypothetical protein QFZ34_002195 [Phyllobacterium ifriqiyense]|uniref:TIR domain-containing protein n=1 Tax=Phyllobacterium ifriqiyense TaxID=314238 RepID=A0ABU0SB93_9HYPH|nr:toll/interleukin-1 receptor domain-containing protein [Phyllobacterium ifriqiyense]MDQ0997013.1 hypothetical protein [Phyllobacterium ifriqiyense]
MANKSAIKPTIFISHISEEAALAILFKNQIEKSFLNTVNVFVSSNADSISIGQRWLDNISNGLKECAAMLVFCSPQSVGRPWINFEAGAGWVKGIEVVPVCHSGMTPSGLPIPLKLLQGMLATDKKKLLEVFELVAEKLGSSTPDVDVDALNAKIVEFENAYVFENGIGRALSELGAVAPRVLRVISSAIPGKIQRIDFTKDEYENCAQTLSGVERVDEVRFKWKETGLVWGDGEDEGMTRLGNLTFTPSLRLIEFCRTF